VTATAKQPKPETVMEFHPLAEAFPLIDGAAFDELVADIDEHGVREPIVLYEGKILDGRNRWRAARAAGAPCPHRVFDGDDPVAFVISANLHRRHLNESQRAMIAAKLVNVQHGGDRGNQYTGGKTPIGVLAKDDAVTLCNVSEGSINRAQRVRRDGPPEMVAAIERGELRVSKADNMIRESPLRANAVSRCWGVAERWRALGSGGVRTPDREARPRLECPACCRQKRRRGSDGYCRRLPD
jgi:hypothetical protein